MTTIGLIGGMSWESTAVYGTASGNEGAAGPSRAGCASSRRAAAFGRFRSDRRDAGEGRTGPQENRGAGRERRGASNRAGPRCLVLCTNTMHKVADQIIAATKLALILHLADR